MHRLFVSLRSEACGIERQVPVPANVDDRVPYRSVCLAIYHTRQRGGCIAKRGQTVTAVHEAKASVLYSNSSCRARGQNWRAANLTLHDIAPSGCLRGRGPVRPSGVRRRARADNPSAEETGMETNSQSACCQENCCLRVVSEKNSRRLSKFNFLSVPSKVFRYKQIVFAVFSLSLSPSKIK